MDPLLSSTDAHSFSLFLDSFETADQTLTSSVPPSGSLFPPPPPPPQALNWDGQEAWHANLAGAGGAVYAARAMGGFVGLGSSGGGGGAPAGGGGGYQAPYDNNFGHSRQPISQPPPYATQASYAPVGQEGYHDLGVRGGGGYEKEEEEKKRVRMAEQTRALQDWMRQRESMGMGMNGRNSRAEEGKVGARRREEENGVTSPPKRSKGLKEEDMAGDALALMRMAEVRAGLTRAPGSRSAGGGGSASSSHVYASNGMEQGQGGGRGVGIVPTATTSYSSSSLPTVSKASAKRKSAPKGSPATIAPPTFTSSESSHSNPPPAATPYNIPPSPSGPRPLVRPNPRLILRRPIPTPAPPPPPPPSHPTGQKPALLSTAQKKANHIASEQKRRAAIRAGYEGLCTVVPALRAAVEEFEDRVKKAGSGKGEGKKRRGSHSGNGALMGGIEVGGEKVDGRAGPKSEAVVLGKSVDHLRHLLSTREDLLGRLSAAYGMASRDGKVVQAGHRVWEDHWDEKEMARAAMDEEEWSEEDN